MSASAPALSVLDREFLTIRSRLLELAAALDRVDRAGDTSSDPRRDNIHRSLELLARGGSGRAEQVQMLFSLPYKEDWRKEYGV